MVSTRANRKISRGKQYVLIFAALLLPLSSFLLITFNAQGLLHLRHLQQEYQELVQKNKALENDNQQLYQQITRLRTDPAALEHLARQELGLVKKDELIIYFAPVDAAEIKNDKNSRADSMEDNCRSRVQQKISY
ncbi:MAG: septum formation initiator family protein [Deltaproteobacteria bacterium]|nr:septum formation initiator family protein [Deltaproteobacteria bacterium]MBW2071841.1 septum formation initiator family protein [Deltaproteobacteria bacterium]